jgi:hypothetical protein
MPRKKRASTRTQCQHHGPEKLFGQQVDISYSGGSDLDYGPSGECSDSSTEEGEEDEENNELTDAGDSDMELNVSVQKAMENIMRSSDPSHCARTSVILKS